MTSLYRRHRPQTFDEVVGQAAIVRTMRNAIERDKVHHAYLFVGSRGTGKTSIAKILAKSLNCERGPTLQPCGECESCTAIAASTSLDVIEMDAASNNSVDDIRELRERVGLAPAMGRWKVYILDEAHMLTTSAWNAFLKTLEEPPPHTTFVLATTEAHKVPATIVDRCHRFDFQRPSLEEITAVLRRVAEKEGIEADDRALAMIARSATGSFRDAIGTLDQLVTYGGERLTFEDVLEALDVADAELIFGATDALIARDPGAALVGVQELAESGRDAVQFMRDLTAHLRHLIVIQTLGRAPDTFSVTADQVARLESQAGEMLQAEAIRAIDLVAAAIAAVKEGSDPRIQLEVALLKAARPQADASMSAILPRLERLERVEDSAPKGPSAANGDPAGEPSSARKPAPAHAAGAPPGARPVAEAPPASENLSAPEPPPARRPPSPREAPAAANGPAGALVAVETLWPAVLERVREAEGGEMLAALLADARPAGVEDDQLVVVFPEAASFSKRKIERPANGDRLRDAVRLVAGRPLGLRFELSEEREDAGAHGGPRSEDELIERMKDEFDAQEVADESGAEPAREDPPDQDASVQ
jgi:DNA polymerase-3 subunit gamma/tau